MKITGNKTLICFIISFVSILIGFFVAIDRNQPAGYQLLFLLPLSFGAGAIIFSRLFINATKNLATMIILILFFVRMVVSPFFMRLGDYTGTITVGVDENTSYAILLIIYEWIAVCAFLTYKVKKSNNTEKLTYNYINRFTTKKAYYLFFMLVILAFVMCIAITPQVITTKRTIFDITDEFFVNFEDAQVIDMYGTTFLKKFSLVTGQYLFRILLVLLPAVIIIKASKKNRKLLSLIACFIPLFYIGGAIARSLIYIVCLLLLYSHIYKKNESSNRVFLLFALAGIIIIAWWIFTNNANTLFAFMSKRFSAYFSGANVVSGVFNLPDQFAYKIRYFLYDFTSTMPYGNTIFAIAHEGVQPFFNAYNMSYGQIPPTIGMGYYYLGPVFAPIYSVIFANVAFNSGRSMNMNVIENPFRYIRLLMMTFYFSMGIVMYNIEITMTNAFTIFLPMYILEVIAYKKCVFVEQDAI